MNKLDELNARVARELFGWSPRKKDYPPGSEVIRWFNRTGHFIGEKWPPCDPARKIGEAIPLLARHSWTLHTCDHGYRCQVHTAPERGEVLLGDGIGESPMEAICLAVLEANQKLTPQT